MHRKNQNPLSAESPDQDRIKRQRDLLRTTHHQEEIAEAEALHVLEGTLRVIRVSMIIKIRVSTSAIDIIVIETATPEGSTHLREGEEEMILTTTIGAIDTTPPDAMMTTMKEELIEEAQEKGDIGEFYVNYVFYYLFTNA